MDWSNEPATWKQVQSLKRFGCKLDHPLTKIEAAALLSRYGVVSETPLTTSDDHLRDAREPESQRLRVALENARRDLTQAKPGDIDKLKENIARVTAERQRFWVDTCRDLGRSKRTSCIKSMGAGSSSPHFRTCCIYSRRWIPQRQIGTGTIPNCFSKRWS
jgi:hypothetical protein